MSASESGNVNICNTSQQSSRYITDSENEQISPITESESDDASPIVGTEIVDNIIEFPKQIVRTEIVDKTKLNSTQTKNISTLSILLLAVDMISNYSALFLIVL